MTTIGIDPAYAKPIAFAFRANKRWTVVNISPKLPHKWLDLFESAKRMGVEQVVIEGGYVGKNIKTALGLAQIRGALWAVATLAGLPASYVQPSIWQSQMGAQAWRAKLETGRDDLNDDEQAAVCIAAWGDGQR